MIDLKRGPFSLPKGIHLIEGRLVKRFPGGKWLPLIMGRETFLEISKEVNQRKTHR